MTLRLLAVDSATETVHLALVCGDAVLARRVGGGAQASATLLDAAAALLAETQCALADIDAFAFGRGPGAFTGLRTACAVVQGWALGCDRAVLPVDTLMAVAESARQQGAAARVWALNDARMGELYAACYEYEGPGTWRTREAAALWPATEARARLRATAGDGAGGVLGDVAGNALQVHAPLFDGLPNAAWPAAEPEGTALAALARAAWLRGEGVDAARAWPVYVRDKVALTTAEREGARAAAQPAAPVGR